MATDDVLVTQLGAEDFRVDVRDGEVTRSTVVTLPRHVREGLGVRRTPPVKVVEEAVRFLLERTAPADIPASFPLASISGEHPEFLEELRARLA